MEGGGPRSLIWLRSPHLTRIIPHLTVLLHSRGGGVSETAVVRTIFFDHARRCRRRYKSGRRGWPHVVGHGDPAIAPGRMPYGAVGARGGR